MTTTDDQTASTTWPAPNDWGAKHREYIRRGDVIKGADYTTAEHDRLGLFKLRDGLGTYHKTRRISTRLAFMVSVDAASIANGCALNVRNDVYPSTYDEDGRVTPDPAAAAPLAEGLAIWRRSRIDERIHAWATSQATKGDLHLESAVRTMADGTRKGVVYMVRPEHVTLRYDAQDIDLVEAVIAFDTVIKGENDGKPIRYKRVITPETITTYHGDRVVDTYDNLTGVVTLTHIAHIPSDDPTFSAWTGHGYEDSVALENSASLTVQVLGARNAAPKLVLMGGIQLPAGDNGEDAKPADSATPIYELPVGGDMKLVEASLSGVDAMVANADRVATESKATAPQFLFTDAGASSSGLALSNRATQFVAYITPIRARDFAGLARAIGIARCLEKGIPFDETTDVYEVQGGAALPMDKAAFVTMLLGLQEAGNITRADVVKSLQGLDVGLPPDAEPIEYAVRAIADKERADNALTDSIERAGNAARMLRNETAPQLPDGAMEPVE